MKNGNLDIILALVILVLSFGSLALANAAIGQYKPSKQLPIASQKACEGLTPIWISEDTVICVREHD